MSESKQTNTDMEISVFDEPTETCVHACSEKQQESSIACSNAFFQTDLVSVPVKVIPFAKAGPCTTICCGSPVIAGGSSCPGEIGKVCEFTITQKICVKLPLRFGAAVSIDQPRVQCGGISENQCECSTSCMRSED